MSRIIVMMGNQVEERNFVESHDVPVLLSQDFLPTFLLCSFERDNSIDERERGSKGSCEGSLMNGRHDVIT